MVSEDIQRRRDEYTQLMRDHAAMRPAEIVESVRASQAQFLEIMRAVREEQALRKPAPEEWSLRELALHAAFTERLIAKLIHHTARREIPAAADLEGAGIGMMPPDDGRPYAGVLDEIERMNAEIIAAIESLPASPDLEFRLAHPFFGQLNSHEWAGFQRVHDTDHIQHARKIIAATR
jgi:hypothetical protein